MRRKSFWAQTTRTAVPTTWVNAHVDQAHDGGRPSLVCSVEITKVASQGGLDRDIGGFFVANFTHHDHVRILAQEGPEDRGESQAETVLTWHWMMWGRRYSTGSSAFMMFQTGSLMAVRTE